MYFTTETVKGMLAAHLAKQGSTLDDLEQALTLWNQDPGTKSAGFPFKDMLSMTGNSIYAALAAAAGLGATEGFLGYNALNHALNTDKKISEQEQTLLDIQEANAKLKQLAAQHVQPR